MIIATKKVYGISITECTRSPISDTKIEASAAKKADQ